MARPFSALHPGAAYNRTQYIFIEQRHKARIVVFLSFQMDIKCSPVPRLLGFHSACAPLPPHRGYRLPVTPPRLETGCV